MKTHKEKQKERDNTCGNLEPKILAIDEQNGTVNAEYFGTLTTDGSTPKHNNRVVINRRIRKLTPKECWRLMGADSRQDRLIWEVR